MYVPRQKAGEPDPLIGRSIADKFVIQSLQGKGAMGVVYRAHQVALDRPVAIKVLHRTLAQDGLFVARFQREAKVASRIDHPNLTRVIDYGSEPDGLLYLAMEFLDGRDLFQVVEDDWPLSTSSIVDILSQALGGLAAAHDAGVLHRDIKPENIMLLRRKADDGTAFDLVKLCDFGVAKFVESPGAEPPSVPVRKLSLEGFLVGTPAFMSPEQARGEALDARSDIFSVGVVLYQLLTRQLPFECPSPLGVIAKVIEAEPARPSKLADVDPGLEAICAKAMQKAPEDRYGDAREMRAALQALRGQPGLLVLSTPGGGIQIRPSTLPPAASEGDELSSQPPVALSQDTPTLPGPTAGITKAPPAAPRRSRGAPIAAALLLVCLTGLGVWRVGSTPPVATPPHPAWVRAAHPAPEPSVPVTPSAAAPVAMPLDVASARDALLASGLAKGGHALDAGAGRLDGGVLDPIGSRE